MILFANNHKNDMNLYNLPLFVIYPIALIGRFFPKTLLNLRYFAHHKKFINWDSPRNLHEYAQALLFSSTTDIDQYAMLADKLAVRDFVKERIGEEYLTKLYGIFETSDEIKLNALPDSFVLKTNHGCGNNIVVKDKSSFDIESARKKMSYWKQFPYGDLTAQIHYSRIRPMIFAEEYLKQSDSNDILPFDYKFFCYKGEPKYILYYEGRSLNQHETPNMLFDLNWNPLPHAVLRPTSHNIPKPKSLNEMISCAKRLSSGFEFVRVDFYEIGKKPVFGEMTFTPDILANIYPSFTDLMLIHKQ